MPERRRKEKFEYKVRLLSKMRKPIRELLVANGVPRKDWDYYRLMVHWITKGMVKSYHDTYLVTKRPPSSSEWFCRLYSKIMDGSMGHRYAEVLGNLERWGVVCRGASYCKSDPENELPGKCKAVWFTEEYSFMLRSYCYVKDVRHLFGKAGLAAGSKVGYMTPVNLRSRVLLKRLEKCAAERKADQMRDPVVRDAHGNLEHFRIDRKKAEKALKRDIREKNGGKLDRKMLASEMRKVDRFNGMYGSGTALYVVRDDYGRVHTNVTQMKKCVRKEALTCDGEAVGAVDIKSSQGAFLCHILGAWLHGDGAVLGRNGRSFISAEREFPVGLGMGRCEREYLDFRSKLEGRTLYEFFAGEMNGDYELEADLPDRDLSECPVTREEAKKAFLATLFAGVDLDPDCDPLWHACRRVWTEHWPSLLSMVDRLKRDNYRALAYEMQRMESSFVFDVVVPAVKAEVGCPYCTVHDELIVPAVHVGAVDAIVRRELERFGIPTTTEAEGELLEPGEATVRAEMPSCVEVGMRCDWGDRVEERVAEEYASAV
jgi:hypothetical protein